jgi:hypothetical protein
LSRTTLTIRLRVADQDLQARSIRRRLGVAMFKLSDDGTALEFKVNVANIDNVFAPSSLCQSGQFGDSSRRFTVGELSRRSSSSSCGATRLDLRGLARTRRRANLGSSETSWNGWRARRPQPRWQAFPARRGLGTFRRLRE